MSGKNAKLIVIAGANQGLEMGLEARALLLGRGADCDLPLLDTYASREHCWIEPRDDDWWIRDLGSKNGTQIGGTRLGGEQLLHDGDVIVIGATHIRFSDPTDTRTYSLPAAAQSRLVVDVAGHVVRVDGHVIEPPLSPKQWALLRLFWQRRSEAISKDEIAATVWPEADGDIYDYQIDKLVSRLRARLGEPGEALIETLWGFGYKLR